MQRNWKEQILYQIIIIDVFGSWTFISNSVCASKLEFFCKSKEFVHLSFKTHFLSKFRIEVALFGPSVSVSELDV